MKRWGARLGFAAAWAMAAASGPVLAGPVYTYDSLGRLSTVRYDDGRRVTYSYDAAGNRTEVVASTSANQPPVAVPDTLNIYEEAASASINPRTNDSDPDGNPLTVFSAFGASRGTATVSGGATVVYTPFSTRTATDQLYYTITDGAGGSATSTITVNLLNRNPVAVTDTVTVPRNVDHPIAVLANDTDPGNDPLFVVSATNGTKGVATVAGDQQSVTYRSSPGQSGADSFTYGLRDIDGGTATGTVNVTISTANTAPVAASDRALARANYLSTPVRPQTPVFDPRINDTDAEGDPLTITAKTDGAKGIVFMTGTTLSYRYNTFVSGDLTDTDTFTYTVSDGFGGTSTTTVFVTIVVVNLN